MKQAWTLLEMLVAMTLLLFFMGLWSQVVQQTMVRHQSRKSTEWVVQSMDLWTSQVVAKGYDAYQNGDSTEEAKTSFSGQQFVLRYETRFDSDSKSKEITFQVLTLPDKTQIAQWFALLEITQP